MALIINTGLTTQDGGAVATGSFVKFDTYFPMDGMLISCNISVWRDQTAKNNGLSTIKPTQIPSLVFQKTLTEEEYVDLTPLQVHDYVKTYLEEFVGAGNVTIEL